MRRAALVAIPLVALAGALACAGAGDGGAGGEDAHAPDPILAPRGAEIFQTRCASCHGVTGTGDGPAAPALQTSPPDLTRIAARRGGEFPEAAIHRKIDGRFDLPAHGSREMPIWGERLGEGFPEPGLGDEVARGRIEALVEYLKTIQRAD